MKIRVHNCLTFFDDGRSSVHRRATAWDRELSVIHKARLRSLFPVNCVSF